nr:hypothetical protein [Micromonospora sp. DSM 115978]
MTSPSRPEQRSASGQASPSRLALVVIPAVAGTVLGSLGGAAWQYIAGEQGVCRVGEDGKCLSLLFLVPLVGLPLGIVVSWLVLALVVAPWVAPTVTLGGSAVAAYTLEFYFVTASIDGPPPTPVVGLIWGACYAAVAFACLPRLPWLGRAVAIAALAVPATAHLLS